MNKASTAGTAPSPAQGAKRSARRTRDAKGRRHAPLGRPAASSHGVGVESGTPDIYEKRDPLGSPFPGALFAPPRPEPAQRAPGAGGALVSHRVAPAVPSALAGLTSGFGMGPGVPRPPWPPAPGGRCGAGCAGAGGAPGRPGGRTALGEDALLRTVGAEGTDCVSRRARPISGARLRRSRALHLRPINQVVSLGPYRREGPSRGRLPA